MTGKLARELFFYNNETGEFLYRVKRNNMAAGMRVGYISKGYWMCRVKNKMFLVHRLIWLYVTGQWPNGFIDHINGNPSDNRWTNLRVVTNQINQQNQRKARKDSTTGLLGVTKIKKRFVARIRYDGKKKHLGSFDTAMDAHLAYLKAKRVFHEGCTI